MKIVFRADASVEIGSGHVMRCLTLADQLRAKGAEVAFICRDLPGSMFDLLQARGYRNIRLPFTEVSVPSQSIDANETIEAAAVEFPDGFDWLVVDHYALDATWERFLRSSTRKIMVIDDLANRQHDCDLLLDQNYYRNFEQRYKGLVPEHCITLLGPEYVLLRPEFADARKRLRKRDGKVRRILVFFGGSDPDNQTKKALEALKLLNLSDVTADIVVGSANPHKEQIKGMCNESPNLIYHCQVSTMAELILDADLGLGAGGATTWERCALGLPTITLVFADNQLKTTCDLDELGIIRFQGWANKTSTEQLADSIQRAIHNTELLSELSRKSLLIMQDWRGADAVVKTINMLT